MPNAGRSPGLRLLGASLLLVAAGCGGTKVLREAHPVTEAPPLLSQSDARIAVSLDTIVVRNGPGSWSRNAFWDEYRLRVRAPAEGDLKLTRIALVDALGQVIESRADRGELIDASREIEERYGASDRLSRDAHGAWMMAGGAAVAVVGAGATSVALAGGIMGGTAALGAAATMGALMAGGGVILVGAGVARLVNNAEVNAEIRKRQTPLPITLASRDAPVTAIFPITPLPSALELTVADGTTEHRLRIATLHSLTQVHVPRTLEAVSRPAPPFPQEAVRAGIETGHVKALLFLDENGEVARVHVLETSSRALIAQAVYTFRSYRYNPGEDDRTVEEVMQFRR